MADWTCETAAAGWEHLFLIMINEMFTCVSVAGFRGYLRLSPLTVAGVPVFLNIVPKPDLTEFSHTIVPQPPRHCGAKV